MKPEGGHWYSKSGEAMHFVPKKDGSGNRPTTLADARKLNLLPSVTTILKILHKQALVEWLINQAVMAVATSTQRVGETVDEFLERVLKKEKQQEQESQKARELGTDIHDALEQTLSGGQCSPEILPWIQPCQDEIVKRGKIVAIEKILVGDGYAGKTDLIQDDGEVWIWDWKSASKLPEKGSWPEHRLQLAAYAAAYTAYDGFDTALEVRTGNIYISTKETGKFAVFENPDWTNDYNDGFLPLVKHWNWSTGYTP